MKKLVKIKLINWYTFNNTTIEIKDNTLISGQNGTGKSTLLDAIQYVLTAGNAKFNKAADEKSMRTLEAYVRGKVSTENKEYLRTGDVTSYICLEFKDDDTKRIDIIGVCISVPISGKLDKKFFKITNQEINDQLFILNNYVKTYHEFKKDSNCEIFISKSEITGMIKSVLGLSNDKYFELINKALAYRPINKLNDFVYNFLLKEDKINLEELQSNVNALNELQNIIENEENKIKELEIIEKENEKYQKIVNEKLRLSWVKNSLLINNKNDDIQKSKKCIQKNKEIEENNKRRIVIINKEIGKIDNDIMLFKKNNNVVNLNVYDELNTKLQLIKNENSLLQEKHNHFMKEIQNEKKLLKEFSWNKIDKIDNTDSMKLLIEHQKNIEKEKSVIFKEKLEYEDRQKKIINKNKEIKEKLNFLNKNQFPYEYNLIVLQKTIKEKLQSKYGMDIEIRPLCEYLNIIDLEWADAIEGYLNTQRFDLIIEPKYFDEAIDIYDKLKEEQHIFGIGIVNTIKLQDEEIKENTLASKIKASNIYANRYMLKLLNNVYCANNNKDLKNYVCSITKKCMYYKNFVVRGINPKIYEDKFIGETAKKEQMIKYQQDYNDTNRLLEEVNTIIKEDEEKYQKLLQSNIVFLINNVSVLKDLELNEKELLEKENLLKELEKDKLLFDIINKINMMVDNKNNLEKEKNNIIETNGALNNEINNQNEKISYLEEEIELLIKTLPPKENAWTIEENDDLKNIDNKINNNSHSEGKEISLIETLLNNFNTKFQYDEIPNIVNVTKYLEYLYKLRDSEIVKHKSESIKFKESCQKSFQEDFIINLRDKINNAKEEIKLLNKGLKDRPFGKEKYEFIIDKCNDSELSCYYDIITSGADYVGNSLFSDNLTVEQSDRLEGLFYKLMNSSSEMNEKILDEYTDYRRYLSYDIKITNDEGDSYLFSKVLNEKSGGETQTPFYVIIASSFENLMKSRRRDSNIGCVVLFDEAFNNMDESRIEAMMNFYTKELNIQLIISVPPNKIPTIAPYMDTNLIISKHKYISSIQTFKKEDLVFDME